MWNPKNTRGWWTWQKRSRLLTEVESKLAPVSCHLELESIWVSSNEYQLFLLSVSHFLSSNSNSVFFKGPSYPHLSVPEVGAGLHFYQLGWGMDPGSWQISVSHFQGHYIWLRIGHLIQFRPMREWCLGHIFMFFRMFQWQVGNCWGPGCGSQEWS